MSRPSLPELVARLKTFQYPGGVRVQTGDGETTDWYEVMLFPPATEADVAEAERVAGKRLPAELTEFWRHSNGANLFVNESSLHGVGLASTDLLADLQIEEEEVYGADPLDRYIVFARVNGAGDFLVIDERTGRVLDGVHAEQPQEWKPIAESLTHWLELLIQADGRYFWIEALYEPTGAGS